MAIKRYMTTLLECHFRPKHHIDSYYGDQNHIAALLELLLIFTNDTFYDHLNW